MAKKYKFILTLPDDIEVDSAEEIEGHTIYPSRSQTDPFSLKGVFNSYEEAKEAASKCKVYRLKIIFIYSDGVTQSYDSFYGWDDEGTDWPIYKFDPDDFEHLIKKHIEVYEYGDMYLHGGGPGHRYKLEDGTRAVFKFPCVRIYKRKIVEFDD